MAVAILAALLAAGCVTAGVAYVVRSSFDASKPVASPTAAAIAAATEPPSPPPDAGPTSSPTPRRISTPRRIATHTPAATATSTLTPRPRPTRTPAATATIAPLYLATGEDLAAWTGSHWDYADGILANDGTGIAPEEWLAAADEVPSGAYAVEADIRTLEMDPSLCEQSFGVVAGGAGGTVWGGGVIFACDGIPRARITDVTVWSDGYNRHRLLDAATYDPHDTWHTYRLEVDGNALRLLIDGQVVVEVTDDEASEGTEPAQVGLWSQGVRLEVRRIAVYAV